MSGKKKDVFTALSFLLPNLIGFLAFTLLPVILSFCMAFTNWSLKPAIASHYLGLQNFIDILGARSIQHGQPIYLALYCFCILALLTGTMSALWAQMADWKGTRAGAFVIALTGLALIWHGIHTASQGLLLSGLLAAAVGTAASFQDKPWRFGTGTIPSLLILFGAMGTTLTQQSVNSAYELRDPYFYQYLYNTVFLMIGIPFGIAGSLALAILLHEQLPTGPPRMRIILGSLNLILALLLGSAAWIFINPNLGLITALFFLVSAAGFAFNVVAFRTLFYLPTFTAGVALMILWHELYNPKTGPINTGLAALFHLLGVHAHPPEWLASVTWAKPALIVMGIWTGIGGMNMLLYLAGLSNMPKELLEAAEMDGAGEWSKFRHIVWPQLAPTTFFITIMGIIGGLQGGFEQARVMTNGGPAGSTTTLSYYIYTKAFQDLDMGYAAAISWTLFAIVFAATALNWKFGKGLESD